MPTTGFLNGNNLRVYLNGNAVLEATSHDFTLSANMRDVTTKGSAGWKEVLPGLKEWSVSGDGLVKLDSTYGAVELADLLIAGTEVTVRFTTNTSGDEYWTGSAYVDNCQISSPANETPTYSFSCTGTSTLAKATLT